MNYAEYLASPQWRRIRQRVLRRDRGLCRSCGRRAYQVHHGSYSRATMEGRELSQLFAVCGRCHLAATFSVTGSKRTWTERVEMAAALNQPVPHARKAKVWKPKKAKRPRVRLDMEGIRGLSREYAEGRMP